MNVRLNDREHGQITAAIEDRRDVLDKVRKKLIGAHCDTRSVDEMIETLDTVKAALGIEPENMFNKPAGE